ncbi:MAG TPA: bifunctional phosphopantothenoylcysteine decarboxylase/phosphopantothenate--cysteine ligase CoaBC [Bacteroidales bacterium]|nr:bifunctional phosphopantothenoylcysteine decarboxylase/phosphopantothenate--cysteine ligase CoaBC [Bacteroidales bacterium]
MKLANRKILLGVTGSIAAYKAALLVRLFVKEGAEVIVIMTNAAKEFITPLTLATLSKHSVLSEFFEEKAGDWNSHVELGLWADVMIIAPTTANTMAKMAHGIADNLLLTTYLSARCPILHAPAMDLDMFKHPATLQNMEILLARGNYIIEPASGELASGLEGKGRMEEPENILKYMVEFFNKKKTFEGKRILITAGPTHEQIDPVRFIGNNSTGKMGYAIAENLAEKGAEVVLISGPVAIKANHPKIKVVKVENAKQMLDASENEFAGCDAAIMAAAVADFTPVTIVNTKVKRGKENWNIELKPTADIAAELGKMKTEKQVLVGFALETTDEYKNAELKLQKKNLDFIVLNSLNDSGAGFGTDTNKVTIIEACGSSKAFELKQKTEVADDISNYLLTFMQKK